MSLNFPANPADNDTYSGYIYNAAKGVWNKIPNTTDSVSEGTQNLYFTDQRALDATSAAYDAAGSAATAESNANSYTDGEISSLDTSLKSYADTAEADANIYTDDLVGDATVDGTAGNTVTDRIATAVSSLVDSAPAALDTLNELAAALGDDASFSTTITNSIAAKADSASPSFTGTVDFSGATVSGLNLTNLSDVTITTPSEGQALVYDSASGEWINETPASTLPDLTDVTITSAVDGEVLTYNSGTWENQAIAVPESRPHPFVMIG